jgi:L-fuculose-phosphate aldolase
MSDDPGVRHEAARRSLAAAARALAADGLVLGTAGNLSARHGEEILVTPTGAVLAGLQPGEVAIVDLAGAHLDGPSGATSELGLHLALYERHGAGAVVHVHSPMATALACVEGLEEVPTVHYGMLDLGGTVRIAPYATFGSEELAEAVLEALRDGRTAALMANHGTVCFGPDLESALSRVRLLEWACGVYWHARAIGTPRVLRPSDLDEVRATIRRLDYGAPQRA